MGGLVLLILGLIGGMMGVVVEFSKEDKIDGTTGVMKTNTRDPKIVKARVLHGTTRGPPGSLTWLHWVPSPKIRAKYV